MRLTNYSDYALRTLMYLAVIPESDTLATISDVADSYQISKSHLTKIIHQLAQLGYIKSIRGKNGGIRLAMPASDINLGIVMRQTEPDFDIVPCFNALVKKPETKYSSKQNAIVVAKSAQPCVITPACQLKSVFAEATHAFLEVMDKYTLADIIQNDEVLREILKRPF